MDDVAGSEWKKIFDAAEDEHGIVNPRVMEILIDTFAPKDDWDGDHTSTVPTDYSYPCLRCPLSWEACRCSVAKVLVSRECEECSNHYLTGGSWCDEVLCRECCAEMFPDYDGGC